MDMRSYLAYECQDSLAEWSKALASGASPQGRGFEPHSCHLLKLHNLANGVSPLEVHAL